MDVIDVEDDDLQLMVDDDLQLEEPDLMASATATGEDSGVDNDWVIVRRPGPQNRRKKRSHEDPRKEGSEVDPNDYPPRQDQNREKRLRMPLRRKQNKKQRTEMAPLDEPVPSSDTLIDLPNPDTSVEYPSGEVGGNFATGRRSMPLNFEILIPQTRVGRTSSGQPFPDLTEFMSQWGASDQNKE